MADEDCANPLLLKWIKEWLDEARERNSKGVAVYKKAYDSMKACPLVFNHPSEAQQLSGFGPKLCERLTENLKKYCAENGLPMPERPEKAKKRVPAEESIAQAERPAKRARNPKPYVPAFRSGPYGLIMALSTLDEDAPVGLTKSELIELAQPHCDSSYTVPPDPSKFHTAWNSMKTLLQKDLVYEHGRPTRRYMLTEEGWETAKRIRKAVSEKPVDGGRRLGSSREFDVVGAEQDVAPSSQEKGTLLGSSRTALNLNIESRSRSSLLVLDQLEDDQEIGIHAASRSQTAESIALERDKPNTRSSTPSTCAPIELPAGSFTIELILDVREIRTKRDRDYISNELSKKGIDPIVRSLELGDALWVAKCKEPSFLSHYGEESDELMLDWIIERKRLDDLIGSIKDGRFHEQKFRLRRSGVKNVIYLIEEFAAATESAAAGGRFQEAVASAIASTQVVNGYFVKRTRNLDDTIRYLARMTTMLRNKYCSASNPTRISLLPTKAIDSHQTYLDLLSRYRSVSPATTFATSFSTFSALSSKSEMLSLRDVFLKMLMCTRGVTGDKALEIQKRWPTPRALVEAFEEIYARHGRGEEGRKAAEDMVASTLSGLVGRKKIGKALSKKIAEVWGPP
ncbi:hypothetical protein VTO42DRAFT_5911 [Malbranchea cinnamomea]